MLAGRQDGPYSMGTLPSRAEVFSSSGRDSSGPPARGGQMNYAKRTRLRRGLAYDAFLSIESIQQTSW